MLTIIQAELAGYAQSLIEDARAAAQRAQPMILIADDDTALAGEIADYLGRYGMQGVIARDFADALSVLAAQRVDAVLLDLRFGQMDVLPLLPQLCRMSDAPVLVHTANQDETDRVLGLELGADDFLLKPISGRELVARLRAQLRRPRARWLRPGALPGLSLPSPGMSAAAGMALPAAVAGVALPPAAAGQEKAIAWRIVPGERRVYRPDGSPVKLTAAEFDLLLSLARPPGEIRSREVLAREVFRRDWRPGDRAIDNAVLHLRQKLAPELGQDCIVTVRQHGYMFPGFPAG